jgi:hypothetical protein
MSTPRNHRFKRDQVELAITKVVRSGLTRRSAEEIKADLKRLLDVDRNPKTKRHEWAADQYAFFDEPPPGRGGQIAYGAHNAFCLLIGWHLLATGMPQSAVVHLLRLVRNDLESEFRRIMNLDPASVRPEVNFHTRESLLADGALVHEPSGLSFFISAAGVDAAKMSVGAPPMPGQATGVICASLPMVHERLRYYSHVKVAVVVLELVNAAYQLVYWIERVPTRRRGPAG